MLFTVEFFDAVASVVVLAEIVLLLFLVKGGTFVPGSVRLGGLELALQNVDCTRGQKRWQRARERVPSSTASDTTSKALASKTEGIAMGEVESKWGVKASWGSGEMRRGQQGVRWWFI
jgi:hypothetical protein